MKVIITGSNGLLGQNLIDLLLREKEKYQVFGLSRGENRSGRDDFEYVNIDISNPTVSEYSAHQAFDYNIVPQYNSWLGVTGFAAIIDADGGLFSTDFRAEEKLAQLLTQVSGRAGRRAGMGQVVLQTHQPQAPLFEKLRVKAEKIAEQQQAAAEAKEVQLKSEFEKKAFIKCLDVSNGAFRGFTLIILCS